MDHARGLGALTTVRASQAAARQRAGRAGREAPGAVYRCWTEAEHGRLPRFPAPEIKVADLAAFALQAACWGDPSADGLALLDAPPAGAMAAARAVLTAIGAVDEQGRATDRGARMARLGLHPRLARALLDGASEVGGRRAAEVVALLSEEPPREYGDDLAAAWRTARRGGRRVRGALAAGGAAPAPPSARDASHRTGRSAEARRRAGRGPGVPRAGGAGARRRRVPDGVRHRRRGWRRAPGSRGADWLAVAVADRPVAGRVRAGCGWPPSSTRTTARLAAGHLLTEGEEVHWEDGDVVARRVEPARRGRAWPYGRCKNPDPALVRDALLDGLAREGLGLLRWTRDAQRPAGAAGVPAPGARGALARRVRRRAARPGRRSGWSRSSRGPGAGPTSGGSRRARRSAGCCRGPAGEAARLDELAPERIQVPSGSRIRVEYGGEQPVLAVKLQEMFGLDGTPAVAGVPVLVHLLSPAGPPGRRHRRPGELLARGVPRRAGRTARPLSQAPLAGGPDCGAEATRFTNGAAQAVTGSEWLGHGRGRVAGAAAACLQPQGEGEQGQGETEEAPGR